MLSFHEDLVKVCVFIVIFKKDEFFGIFSLLFDLIPTDKKKEKREPLGCIVSVKSNSVS